MALVVQDRLKVAVVEAAGQRRGAQRLVHHRWAVQLGQGGRLGQLGADAGRAGRGGLQQPLPGALANGQERGLFCAACPWLAIQRARRAGRVVLVTDLRVAGGGAGVAGDLDGPVGTDVGDHDLLAGDPHPDPLVDLSRAGPSSAPRPR